MRKVILYISCSLDGYIAKPGDDLSFLEKVEKEGEDYGYHDFIKTVDAVIMGRRTYEWVMSRVEEFPHADKETYIITREVRESIGKTRFYDDDLPTLIEKLMLKPGKNIFVDGGGETVRRMLNNHLIDEMIISIVPVILGNGIKLFACCIPEFDLELLETKTFDTGLVQLKYKLLKKAGTNKD